MLNKVWSHAHFAIGDAVVVLDLRQGVRGQEAKLVAGGQILELGCNRMLSPRPWRRVLVRHLWFDNEHRAGWEEHCHTPSRYQRWRHEHASSAMAAWSTQSKGTRGDESVRRSTTRLVLTFLLRRELRDHRDVGAAVVGGVRLGARHECPEDVRPVGVHIRDWRGAIL